MQKPNGYVIINDPEGLDVEYDTIRCVHCSAHYPHGSTQQLAGGWCGNCQGWICGKKCMECVPVEKWLDIQEGTVDPTAVSVPVTRSIALPSGGTVDPGPMRKKIILP